MRLAALPIVPLLLWASAASAADPPAGSAGSAPDQKPAVPAAEAPHAAVPNAAAPNASRPATALDPAAAARSIADMQRVRERGRQVDPKENEAAEKGLGETIVAVDAATEKKEKVEVAGRLAAEFGGTPELYLAERERLKTGWGQISIAHTILANTETAMTIDQLFALRQEGLGWGQIAHGLDMNVGDFAKTAHARGRSVGGAAKAERAEAKANPAAKGKSDGSANGRPDANANAKPDANGTPAAKAAGQARGAAAKGKK